MSFARATASRHFSTNFRSVRNTRRQGKLDFRERRFLRFPHGDHRTTRIRRRRSIVNSLVIFSMASRPFRRLLKLLVRAHVSSSNPFIIRRLIHHITGYQNGPQSIHGRVILLTSLRGIMSVGDRRLRGLITRCLAHLGNSVTRSFLRFLSSIVQRGYS